MQVLILASDSLCSLAAMNQTNGDNCTYRQSPLGDIHGVALICAEEK